YPVAHSWCVRLLVHSLPMLCLAPRSLLFPYTTLFRSAIIPPIQGSVMDLAYVDGELVSKGYIKASYIVPLIGFLYLAFFAYFARSEEHTSELQSRENLVCRLLLEKKKSVVHMMRISRK